MEFGLLSENVHEVILLNYFVIHSFFPLSYFLLLFVFIVILFQFIMELNLLLLPCHDITIASLLLKKNKKKTFCTFRNFL